MWGIPVLLVALFGISAFADESLLIFPEDARELPSEGFETRIVSGWPAQPGQLPHQLSIRMVNSAGSVSSCGASLVHQQWGISAAHCTAQRTTLVIRAGTVNLTRPNMIFEATQMFNHPDFNENFPTIVQPHDISLIRFQSPLDFNSVIQPIRIQRHEDRDRNYNGVQMVASGWGRTWTNGNATEILNWVYLTGVTNQRCSSLFGGSWIIQDSTICAGGYNDTTQNPCQGDSGGPLTVLEKDGKTTLVGVTSFVSGRGCHADLPAGFVRPGHYHAWFTQVTGIDFDWDSDSDENSTDDPYSSDSNSSSESNSDTDEESSFEKGVPNANGEVFGWLH
ncbi:hypothetical protein ACJJTC_010866 [Scirpophaga incertulas]